MNKTVCMVSFPFMFFYVFISNHSFKKQHVTTQAVTALFLDISLFSWLSLLFPPPLCSTWWEWVPLLPWCPAAHLCLISGSAAAVLIQIVHRPCVSSSGSSMLPEIFLCLAAEVFSASPWDSSTRLPHRLIYLRNSLHCPATVLGNEKLVVYNLCMRANSISINRNLEKQMLNNKNNRTDFLWWQLYFFM